MKPPIKPPKMPKTTGVMMSRPINGSGAEVLMMLASVVPNNDTAAKRFINKKTRNSTITRTMAETMPFFADCENNAANKPPTSHASIGGKKKRKLPPEKRAKRFGSIPFDNEEPGMYMNAGVINAGKETGNPLIILEYELKMVVMEMSPNTYGRNIRPINPTSRPNKTAPFINMHLGLSQMAKCISFATNYVRVHLYIFKAFATITKEIHIHKNIGDT